MDKSSRKIPFKLVAGSFAMTAAGLMAGCGQPAPTPANYFEVRMEADAPNAEQCNEAVAIRFEPVQIDAQQAGSPYDTRTYTDQPVITGKPVKDGPDELECWFNYRSRDLAPGTWRIVGEFSSGPQSCEREVRPGKPNRVRIDQEDGCVEFDAPLPATPKTG